MGARRILLTGATGFIGARIAERLRERGHSLGLLIRRPKPADRAAEIYGACAMICGDLQSPASYADALRAFRPDILVHAAWTGASGAERNDLAQIGNITATAMLLETAIAADTKLIGLGSQAEYGPQNRKLDEQAPTAPTTLYGRASSPPAPSPPPCAGYSDCATSGCGCFRSMVRATIPRGSFPG